LHVLQAVTTDLSSVRSLMDMIATPTQSKRTAWMFLVITVWLVSLTVVVSNEPTMQSLSGFLSKAGITTAHQAQSQIIAAQQVTIDTQQAKIEAQKNKAKLQNSNRLMRG
jgi:hypothetical protein